MKISATIANMEFKLVEQLGKAPEEFQASRHSTPPAHIEDLAKICQRYRFSLETRLVKAGSRPG